jgi:hypothetical protein
LIYSIKPLGYCLYCALQIVGIQALLAQAENEIQVYASPTVGDKQTIFELHSNHTPRGVESLADPKMARWVNETLEITHGFGNVFEVGFYTFTGFSPDGRYQYLGNQIRPRLSVPEKWGWSVGASLSVEFGFFRPDENSDYIWQGEIRPILDKTLGQFYFSFNPNISFVSSGAFKAWVIAPQLKSVYTIKEKIGLGFEYYSDIGSFTEIPELQQQEHLIGPMIDLYLNPDLEINGGYLFGLTEGSNRQIVKLILGYRVGK